MAIESIVISQDNKVDGSDLLPVHSTLVFLADVTYNGSPPERLNVKLFDEQGITIDTYRAIPYRDILSNVRQFAFVANDVIKGIMGSFDDTAQLLDTLIYVPNITKLVKIRFIDPDDELTFNDTTVTFIHGSAQFGDNPNLDKVYNNSDSCYYGPEGGFVYVYFYNEDENNILTVDNASVQLVNAQDYDDNIFEDYDDELFEIDIAI